MAKTTLLKRAKKVPIICGKRRMERAKILLLSTDMKNYEIAESLGFEDANYFSTSFKKKYGISPNQYKEKVRE